MALGWYVVLTETNSRQYQVVGLMSSNLPFALFLELGHIKWRARSRGRHETANEVLVGIRSVQNILGLRPSLCRD
jgi:hypothetical protein